MPLKKVLIVYSSRPPIISDLAEAFAGRGVITDHVLADETHWFDRWVIRRVNKQLHNFRILPKSEVLFAKHPWAHFNYRSNKLATKISEFSPDLVFLVRGINYRHDVLVKAPMLFGWWIEREERTAEAIREAKLFDWYFFISRASVEQAALAGYSNASYQSHVVNPLRFLRLPISEKKHDVCFVGNWSKHRQAYLEAVLKVTPNVAIYGRKWRRNNLFNPALVRAVKAPWIDGEQLNALYNESRVVLNVTNWGAGNGKARSGMNMRIFEVPASGAFLLTDESREMEEFLTPGEHVAVYDDLDDMQDKLRIYLSNVVERERIADKGYAHVRQNYTYDQIVQRVIDVFDNLKGVE